MQPNQTGNLIKLLLDIFSPPLASVSALAEMKTKWMELVMQIFFLS